MLEEVRNAVNKLGIEADCTQIGDENVVNINLPFLNYINDNFYLYVEKVSDNHYIVADDGDNINEFYIYLGGRKISRNVFNKIINPICKKNGCVINKEQIQIETNEKGLSDAITKITQVSIALDTFLLTDLLNSFQHKPKRKVVSKASNK